MADNRIAGSTDLPLSVAGQVEAKEAARHMQTDHFATIYHPADEAAKETAQTFATALKAKPRAIAELADPNLGLLEGITAQDFAERYAKRFKQWEDDPLMLSPPEGEEMAEARSRIFAAVARLLKRSRGDETAVVLHTLGTGLLRCWLADCEGGAMWRLLESRPMVERYVFSDTMIRRLEAAAETEYARA